MSTSPKNLGDSPDASPNVPSEKQLPGQTDRPSDKAAVSGDASGLPAYMRASAQETPSSPPAAPATDNERSSLADQAAQEKYSTTGEGSPAPETPASAEFPQGQPQEIPRRQAETSEHAPEPMADENGQAPFATAFDTPTSDNDWASEADAKQPAGAASPQPAAPAAKEPDSFSKTPTPAPAKEPASFPETPRPARYSFAGAHPLLTADQAMPASLCSRLFDGLALFPLLPLTVLLVLQTIFTLDARGLWFSDEIRHAAAFQTLLDQGKWLILEMNGQVYPDKPPLYFLFLRGLYELVRTDGPMLHFTAAAVSALLYLWAALGLGRLAARVDRRTNLAAGILLLSTGYFIGVMHYARMDLLFSALILCSHIALYRAFVSPTSSYKGMILGFLLAGLACLVKGPLGLALPLCSFLFFAIWRGTPQRLFRPDFLVGLIAGLIPIALWLGAIYWTTGSADFILNSLIKQQVVERAVDTFHHKEAWNYYLLRLPLMVLPWTLLFFFLPWGNFMGRNMRSALAASRRPEAEGLAFLWSMVLSAVALLSLLSGKILIYFLPALPALAILSARAVLRLDGTRAGMFRRCMALLMLIGAVALVLAALALFGLLPTPDMAGLPQWKLPTNGAFFIVSAILLLVSGLLWTALRSNRPEGILLVMALAATALGYPLAGLVAPSFDAVLSPKAQALLMRAYIQDGYAPASYKVYGGTYTFYAGHTVPALEQLPASGTDKMVIGMQRSRLKEWDNKPDCFKEVHSQWIETREYVLLACPAKEGMQPAAVPYKPAPDVIGTLMKLTGIQFPAKQAKPETPKAPEAPKTPETAPEKSQPIPDQPTPKAESAPEAPAPAAEPAKPEAAPAPTGEPAAKPEAAPAAPEEKAAPPASPDKAPEAAPQPGEAAPDAGSKPDSAVPDAAPKPDDAAPAPEAPNADTAKEESAPTEQTTASDAAPAASEAAAPSAR